MTKAGDWNADWFPGGAVAISVVLFSRLSDAVPGFERRACARRRARKQGSVHRDIEPASRMREPVSDSPRVTDSGIVRVTDSSRNKMRMLPERLPRKKVDGRSDLYSLALSLYQLLCGSPVGERDAGL